MAPASPKEKRRSTRRSAHSSSKSSGSSGSPTPDAPPASAAPALSDAARSAASSSSGSAPRGKRAKDDGDDFHAPPPSSSHRRTNSHASAVNGTFSAPTPSSSKRTKRKGKDAVPVDDTPDATSVDAVDSKNTEPDEPVDDAEKAEEDGGITRCVCDGLALDDDGDAPDFMIQCEQCLAWQHGPCMGFPQESEIPEGNYYCERCKPEDHVELLKKLQRRQRHSSEKSVQASQRSRTSRSHSPTYFLKPPKRRNTMNSRDAAYEEQLQELLDATAAEATPNNDASSKDRAESVAKTEEPYEEIIEIGPGGRKKRKRADDDIMPAKRKRSASLISEGLGATGAVLEKPEVMTPITTALLPPPPPTGKSRARRGGGRKNAAAQEVSANGEAEDAPTPTTKKHPNQYTYRAKSSNNQSRRAPQSSSGQNQQNSTTHEHGTRRNAKDAANSGGSGPGSRSNHSAYYNNLQLPMFASWGLPDYLAHLQSILPSEVPSPLQIRGSTSFIREDLGDANANSSSGDASNAASVARGSVGPSATEPPETPNPQMAEVLANATESVTERGVKVKWPAKRMSVADMNKRVRALVEWVGREQALALDRERRKVALESALNKHLESLRCISILPALTKTVDEVTPEEPSTMLVDRATPAKSPEQEQQSALPEQGQDQDQERDRAGTEPVSATATATATKDKDPTISSLLSTKNTRPSTTKMMEELMEELISFQERFGPSAKGQTRDRRVAAMA